MLSLELACRGDVENSDSRVEEILVLYIFLSTETRAQMQHEEP